MKYKILYFYLLLAIAVAGCLKNPTAPPAATPPSGTFTGKYTRFHRHTDKNPFDSVQTTLTVKLSTADYTYAVTGDTSSIHAGSYGSFGITSPFIGFSDKTYSATTVAAKAHLAGYYNYTYDGTNLLMYVASSDTLLIRYTLKKSN